MVRHEEDEELDEDQGRLLEELRRQRASREATVQQTVQARSPRNREQYSTLPPEMAELFNNMDQKSGELREKIQEMVKGVEIGAIMDAVAGVLFVCGVTVLDENRETRDPDVQIHPNEIIEPERLKGLIKTGYEAVQKIMSEMGTSHMGEGLVIISALLSSLVEIGKLRMVNPLVALGETTDLPDLAFIEE